VTTSEHSTRGPLALVGSGEYLESMVTVEAHLLHNRPPKYVQLATAAHNDGPDRVAYWHELGRQQAERLGVTQVVVPVSTREDAERDDYAALIEGAGLIYLSGGDPHYLASTLKDTAVARAIFDAWHNGSALAGCSAGAMALTSWIPSLRHPRKGSSEGLNWLPHLRVIPHFDYFEKYVPDVVTRYLAGPEGAVLLGIDEQTALVGDGTSWTVMGHQRVWTITGDERIPHDVGDTVTTPRN
jgi:cyanophycinase